MNKLIIVWQTVVLRSWDWFGIGGELSFKASEIVLEIIMVLAHSPIDFVP